MAVALAGARSTGAAAILRLVPAAAAPVRLGGTPGPRRRRIAMAAAASAPPAPADALPKGADSFFRTVISNMEKVYLSRNPTAKTILELVRSYDGDHICYDHFAFRTFGVDGYGINSLAEFFTDFGYVPREELRFPAKKLRALWFSPPTNDGYTGTGVYGPLPRIFISELLVDELSAQSQDIIHKYIRTSGKGNKHATLASTSGELTWEKPIYSDFQVLSRESEYAAWTLVNGYALNHTTISTHRLISDIRSISKFNKFVEDNGFKLNSEGGILKVSPDGLLQQSSTVADSALFTFADGITESIPRSYIEFAERLLLPQFKDLPNDERQICDLLGSISFVEFQPSTAIAVDDRHRAGGCGGRRITPVVVVVVVVMVVEVEVEVGSRGGR
uniref:2-oxoadipate dioxygenase/decarboxylase n=1 Tax=Oryza punctata TaxID=4537 RepID=A0A0E0M8E5_ORYPU